MQLADISSAKKDEFKYEEWENMSISDSDEDLMGGKAKIGELNTLSSKQ